MARSYKRAQPSQVKVPVVRVNCDEAYKAIAKAQAHHRLRQQDAFFKAEGLRELNQLQAGETWEATCYWLDLVEAKQDDDDVAEDWDYLNALLAEQFEEWEDYYD